MTRYTYNTKLINRRFLNFCSKVVIEDFSESSTTAREEYRFPLGLFLVFNELKPLVWTNPNGKTFDYYVALDEQTIYYLIIYLKKHVMTNLSYLVDISFFSPSKSVFGMETDRKDASAIGVWTFYFCSTRVRFNIITSLGYRTPVKSIDSVYRNANWMERECSEMYGQSFYNKRDSRKLLLNYFDGNNPLKKEFNSSSSYEVYFDFTDRQVQYTSGLRSEI